jgi:hypothetical protein
VFRRAETEAAQMNGYVGLDECRANQGEGNKTFAAGNSPHFEINMGNT